MPGEAGGAQPIHHAQSLSTFPRAGGARFAPAHVGTAQPGRARQRWAVNITLWRWHDTSGPQNSGRWSGKPVCAVCPSLRGSSVRTDGHCAAPLGQWVSRGRPAAPDDGSALLGKAEGYFGNPLFPNCRGLGPCLETVQTQQSFGKLASSTPGEVGAAWGWSRTAHLPLAGHGRRSTCALGCEGNETSLSPALRARCDARLRGRSGSLTVPSSALAPAAMTALKTNDSSFVHLPLRNE